MHPELIYYVLSTHFKLIASSILVLNIFLTSYSSPLQSPRTLFRSGFISLGIIDILG